MEPTALPSKPWRWPAAGLTLALCLAPFVVGWRRLGEGLIFNVFAADSMYYLKIADSFAKLGFPTFDGETATNGFQPLWGFLLAAVFRVFRVVHDSQLHVVFAMSVALTAAAYLVIADVFARRLPGRPGLVATLLLFPGAYSVLLEPRARWPVAHGVKYGLTPWSSANGLETPLSLFLWALLFAIIARRLAESRPAGRSPKDLLQIVPPVARILLAAIVLARLDDCFLAISIAAVVFVSGGGKPAERLGVIARIMLPTAIAVAAYVAWSLVTVGVMLPVSGTTKTGFAALTNLRSLAMVAIGATTIPDRQWWGNAVRLLPLVAAVVAGVAMLWFAGLRARFPKEAATSVIDLGSLLAPVGLSLVLKASFLFLAVTAMSQGYWYCSVATTAINVAVAFAAGRALQRWPSASGWALAAALLVALFRVPNETRFLVAANVAPNSGAVNDTNVGRELWVHRREIRDDLLRRNPASKIVDTDDGMFAYLLDLPGECVTGFASSPQELARRRELGLWPSLVSRGFTLVPAYGYADPRKVPDVVRVTETFRPPGSPIDFMNVELVKH